MALIDARNSFWLSIFGIFNRFSSNFALKSILRKRVLGLQMDLFCQIITELWPLIDVQNCVLLNIF